MTVEVRDVTEWALTVIGLITGAGGATACIWSVGRVKSVESSLDLLVTANKGLQDAYKQLEERQEAERAKCDRELSELRGQVKTLTGEFAKQIAAAIVKEIKEQ